MSDPEPKRNPPEATSAPQPRGAGDDDSLERVLAQTQARLDEQREAWLRAVADADNARKRAQADVAAAHKFAIERFAQGLLPVVDSLEATLAAAEGAPQALREGVQLTLRQLLAALEKAGVAPIAPAAGERFDPHQHQAMAAVEAEAEPNSVVAVMQKGYSLHDRVLRPALVTVAKALENKEVGPTLDRNGDTSKESS